MYNHNVLTRWLKFVLTSVAHEVESRLQVTIATALLPVSEEGLASDVGAGQRREPVCPQRTTPLVDPASPSPACGVLVSKQRPERSSTCWHLPMGTVVCVTCEA